MATDNSSRAKSEKKTRRAAKKRARQANARTAERAAKKLDAQKRAACTRAKYGPRGKPAPVVIKSLATGEVIGSVKRAPSPQEIERKRTRAGGWTKATLASWGVFWPPPRGWRRRLEAQWRRENPDAD